MIYGIGTDLISISRVKKVIERKGNRFLERVFTHNELRKTHRGELYFRYFAKRFAAKEALIKAIGDIDGVEFSDIEISNHESGAPYFSSVPNIIKDKKSYLSISDQLDFSLAFVVLETQ